MGIVSRLFGGAGRDDQPKPDRTSNDGQTPGPDDAAATQDTAPAKPTTVRASATEGAAATGGPSANAAPASPPPAAPSAGSPPAPGGAPPPDQQIRIDPMTGKAHTLDGKPVPIDPEVYRTRVLPAIFERAQHLPDLLYQVILGALKQGAFAESVPAAQRLLQIDGDSLRGTATLAIALMNSGKIDEAESLLQAHQDEHGAHGVIMLNMAKCQALRGDQEQAEDTLFDSLEVDPNVPNAVQWWAQLQHQRDADGGFERGLLQVDAIEGSWYAKLWLGRLALQAGDQTRALALYEQAVPYAREHTEPMFMMSGDLGNAGLPQEILRLVGPHYQLKVHGPMTGLNLARACSMLGATERGLALLDEIDAIGLPDVAAQAAELRKAFEN